MKKKEKEVFKIKGNLKDLFPSSDLSAIIVDNGGTVLYSMTVGQRLLGQTRIKFYIITFWRDGEGGG